MRIGDVNQSNYKHFLAMLGVKNTKALDKIMGADQKTEDIYPTEEEVYAKMVKMGRVEEGMLAKEGDNSWKRFVPVSDEVREKLVETARRHLLDLANGIKPNGVEERTNDVSTILKEYRKNIPPSERLAVTWTLSHIYSDEQQRLNDYIKSKIPSWNYGQPFDRDILLNSNFGENSVDIKA
jgi:hypothetical protein